MFFSAVFGQYDTPLKYFWRTKRLSAIGKVYGATEDVNHTKMWRTSAYRTKAIYEKQREGVRLIMPYSRPRLSVSARDRQTQQDDAGDA